MDFSIQGKCQGKKEYINNIAAYMDKKYVLTHSLFLCVRIIVFNPNSLTPYENQLFLRICEDDQNKRNKSLIETFGFDFFR